MLIRGKDIDTLTVQEVSPVITQCGSTNRDNLLSRSGGVRTGIPTVVASGDGKVHATLDNLVRIVQSLGHTATQRHVSDGTLVPCLPGGGELDIGSSELGSLLSGAQNNTDDISHSATSVRTQDPDGVGSLSNPIFAEARPPNLVELVLIPVSTTYMSTPSPPAE